MGDHWLTHFEIYYKQAQDVIDYINHLGYDTSDTYKGVSTIDFIADLLKNQDYDIANGVYDS